MSITERARFSFRSILPSFLGGKKKGFSRRHERYPCVLLGAMRVVDIGAEFDGVILEISQGGCSFRPASMYLLDRTNETVRIRAADFEAAGLIRAARPDSYGVQFFQDIGEDIVRKVVAEHGGRIADSFLAPRH